MTQTLFKYRSIKVELVKDMNMRINKTLNLNQMGVVRGRAVSPHDYSDRLALPAGTL